MKNLLFFISAVLTLFIISGCGVVSRTIYPERSMVVNYECTRNVNIFSPRDNKIYYSYSKSNYPGEYIYDGTSNGDRHTIRIHKNYVASTTKSNWTMWNSNDVQQVAVNLGYEVRKSAYTIMFIRVTKPDGTTYRENSFNLWGWNSDGSFYGNNVQDLPEVSGTKNTINKDDANYAESTLVIDYNDKSIEMK